MQSATINLGWRNHAILDQVAVGASESVEAVVASHGRNLGHHNGAFFARIFSDYTQWNSKCFGDHIKAKGLVAFNSGARFFHGGNAAHKTHAATSDHAFGHGRARRMKRVFNAALLFFQFRFAACANFNLRNAAGQFGQTFLQLLTVVVAISLIHLAANLLATILDGLGAAGAFNNRCVVGVNGDLLHLTKLRNGDLVQINSKILHDGLTTSQNGQIFKHGLAAIAVTRRLDRAHIQHAAHLINDKRAQRFARNILRDNQKRLLHIHHFLKERH